MNERHQITTQGAVSFILKMIQPYKFAVGIMFFVAITWAFEISLRPYIIKVIVNRVAELPKEQIIAAVWIPACIYVLVIFTMSTIFRLYGYFVEINMIPKLRKHIAHYIFNHLLYHSHRYYQNNFAGSLANKVNDLTSSVPDILQISIDRFLSHTLAFTIAVITLWSVNVRFAIVMVLWASLFIFVSYYNSKKIIHYSDEFSELASTLTGKFVDILTNILSVRLFARQKVELANIDKTFGETVRAEQQLNWRFFYIWFFYGYSFVLIQAFNLYFLIQGRAAGHITVGDFALVLMLNIAIVDIMWQLTREFSQFSNHMGKIVQGLRITTAPHEMLDSAHAVPLKVAKGTIVFDKVGFGYQEGEQLFENKSVTIEAGEKIGLVGHSGSGKTTFTNLILRLFELEEGNILIDDQNIQQVTQDSLREQIALIPQEPNLFHRSLFENIQYGKPDATIAEVVEAAKKANAHEFIVSLKEGYDSLVGERGIKLSGGQRQRIAIARAFLKNAPILILDEATSQLDSITEQYIQESLWQLMQNRTTIVIAHRLSTLLRMDRIFVFDKGKIVESGTHQELLSLNGHYAQLWAAQVGGFLID